MCAHTHSQLQLSLDGKGAVSGSRGDTWTADPEELKIPVSFGASEPGD